MKKQMIYLCAALMLAQPVLALSEAAVPAVVNVPQQKVSFHSSLTVAAVPELQTAAAYAVYDAQSGVVLAEKGLNQRIEPASTTKVMTAYLVFQALESGKLTMEQTFRVSDEGYQSGGSRMFLEQHTPASVSDLLKGMIVQSGNDAAITLAEAVAGSESAFVTLMNQEAERLGMSETHFANSTGWPSPEQYSTARDLLRLSQALIERYPQYYHLYSIQSFKYNGIEQPNRNLLLSQDKDVDGLKTGHLDSAGYHLIATSKRNGRRVISVVLGTDSIPSRASESSKLLNWALQSFNTTKLHAAGSQLGNATVYKGSEDEVAVGFVNDFYLTLPQGASTQLTPVLETVQPVIAPITRGQVLGKVRFLDAQQNEIWTQDVYALNDVAEAGWFGRFVDSIVLWFKSLFGGGA